MIIVYDSWFTKRLKKYYEEVSMNIGKKYKTYTTILCYLKLK